MRNDYGTRWTPPRFKSGGSVSKGRKKQGYNDRLDESLGARRGKKSQSFKARRDESKGMEKSMGRRAYAAVGTMDKGNRKR